MELTHIDETGKARMVDVSEKAITKRVAIASGYVKVAPETLALIKQGEVKKGDVLAVARVAGILAAKRTGELIPLCHPLSLESVVVDLQLDEENSMILIEAQAVNSAKTGIEMEALTAVSVAGLTIYDMCKAVDKYMVIGDIKLLHKSGGKSGVFDRDPAKEY
ncbi:MAG: cyclic pyranopterin monophosphate synthase MoaC [Firmicutes bacterium]|nr:cyclic pyranopterin monophosphate synthase MoaC [Bacillota bacterium]